MEDMKSYEDFLQKRILEIKDSDNKKKTIIKIINNIDLLCKKYKNDKSIKLQCKTFIKDIFQEFIDLIDEDIIHHYYWKTDLNIPLLEEIVGKKPLPLIHYISHKVEIYCIKCQNGYTTEFNNRDSYKEYLKRMIGLVASSQPYYEFLCDECKQKLQLENIFSNIIVTKYKEGYRIKFEDENTIFKLSNDYISLINKMFEINNDPNIFSSTEKGKKFREVIEKKENTNIVNTSLFVSIYKWFTDLPLHHIQSVTNQTACNLIIINKDIYENVDNRHGSLFPNYLNFKSCLNGYYKSKKITFNKLFNNPNIIKHNFESKTETCVMENSLEQIKELKTMPYKEYLQTDHWKNVRKRALFRANYKCQLCGSKENLNVHHNTYENRGEEKDEDLVVLCENCHGKFHDKICDENEISSVENNQMVKSKMCPLCNEVVSKEESFEYKGRYYHEKCFVKYSKEKHKQKIEKHNGLVRTKMFLSKIDTDLISLWGATPVIDENINNFILHNKITNIIDIKTNINDNIYTALLVYT